MRRASISEADPLAHAVRTLTTATIAELCAVSSPAVLKWPRVGMPCTEWVGETDYAERIENALGEPGFAERLLEYHGELRRERAAQKAGERAARDQNPETTKPRRRANAEVRGFEGQPPPCERKGLTT